MKYLHKKINILIIICSFVLIGCEKDDTEGANADFITNYATFNYEPLVVVPLGGSFDPSVVTATENGANLNVTINGDYDNTTVGIYQFAYSASNSDGFDATVFQTIVVHDPNIVGTDVSGAIQDVGRPERTGIITLVEGTTSIFHCTDFGFSGNFPMYFQMDGDTISEIPQTYPLSATSVELTYDPNTMLFTTLIQPYGFDYIFEYQ